MLYCYSTILMMDFSCLSDIRQVSKLMQFYLTAFLSGSFFSLKCGKTFDFIFIQVDQICMDTSSWSVCIFSTEQPSSLTQLWIHWKRLSIMPWSDYLVVRLLTHSHHYITGGSLWNYSAIYHSSLHAPYTLNDRLPLHTGCLTHPVGNTESLQASNTKFSQPVMDVGHSYAS